MDPVSHIALFYIFGRGLRMKKVWTGMMAALLPDVALGVLIVMIPLGVGPDSLALVRTANLFLHSVFGMLLVLPFALLSLRHLLASAAGYASHLFLDYLTHAAIRMPFYPLTTWKIPIFVAPYSRPSILLAAGVTVFVFLLVVDGRWFARLFRAIAASPRRGPTLVLVTGFVVGTSFIVAYYTAVELRVRLPILLLCAPLMEVNLLLICIVFFREVYHDDYVPASVRRLLRNLAGIPAERAPRVST